MNSPQKLQIDPNQVFMPRSGQHTLKFKIDDPGLKREFFLALTGASPIATTPEQAAALKQMDDHLASIIGQSMEWALEFGNMFLAHNAEHVELTVKRFAKIVTFVAAHPETVEFNNLGQLRERLVLYRDRLHDFRILMNSLESYLRPEQLNQPVAAPEPLPSLPQTLESGG